ncbi:type II restriction enzyme [Helicobacter cetorum MIT 00-7128]|uniref:Type II restriction enzyme n=1 Tax=Helicobacter cetorum (strain ATCC BAA-429 / MIT 00-7128) TaxID=182217 RepID=I0EKM7_HELC0|nr:type II restriction enzyme [Helicobacter cetorum MIT 00-7128]
MFDAGNGDFDIQKHHINHRGDFVITAGLSNNGVLGQSDIKAKVFESHTITIDMFGCAFYRSFAYKMVTHARVFSLKPKFEINHKIGLFLSTLFFGYPKKFGYENMCSWAKIKNDKVILPLKPSTLNATTPTLEDIDFNFMENFIAELEQHRLAELEQHRLAELDAYLQATGLKNTTLTSDEENALKQFSETLGSLKWQSFNLKNLFGKSTRGKRLKSADRILGDLPFVTAGENQEGVSAFIGNQVEIFPKNTITIDMFGSAKYRNYPYGADDHIAVVHTQDLEKNAVLFITSAIHKVTHAGQFDYSRNFYAKDADEINILLPTTKHGNLDFNFMHLCINALQKQIIKGVVEYNDAKINATKQVLEKEKKR